VKQICNGSQARRVYESAEPKHHLAQEEDSTSETNFSALDEAVFLIFDFPPEPFLTQRFLRS
jgi:hypothetical protein